jgi:hypothetical protein
LQLARDLLRANFRVIDFRLVHTLVGVALSRSPANNHVIYRLAAIFQNGRQTFLAKSIPGWLEPAL